MSPPPGLRERKKRRTRETIARVALELFSEQGYEQTTIAQIAEAADVSPRTVSGYFPAKEELVFPDQEEMLAGLATRLRERPSDEMAPEALRAWLRERMGEWRGRQEEMRAQRRVIDSSEALEAHRQLFVARVQELLAAATAADIGAEPGDLEPRMAAAATAAILEVIGEYMEPAKAQAGSDGCPDLEAVEGEMFEMLDRAVVFVSAGIRALRDRKRP